MSKWIDFTIDERKAMVQKVTELMHIDEAAAEKDWWVTAVLFALFKTKVAKYLLFKGGTSLSKGWNIINRFSEDIDMALGREFFLKEKQLTCAQCSTNTQIHHLREKGQDYIFGEFKEDLQKQLMTLGLNVKVIAENELPDENGKTKTVDHDKDPSVIYIQYPSLYQNETTYATPVVKIEISVLSMDEPFEMKRISSLIEQVFPDEDVDSDIVQHIKTVSPARTFLEKAFLLCEEYQKKTPRTYRMSRHLYDLEKLSHTSYMEMALNDSNLYYDIVEHRKKFYHVGYVDYDKELPSSITILPTKNLIPYFEDDYKAMRLSFIYGDSLNFDELLIFLEKLQERFRHVPTKTK